MTTPLWKLPKRERVRIISHLRQLRKKRNECVAIVAEAENRVNYYRYAIKAIDTEISMTTNDYTI